MNTEESNLNDSRTELRDLCYEERLKECGLTTLETKMLRGDQNEVSKILNFSHSRKIAELEVMR